MDSTNELDDESETITLPQSSQNTDADNWEPHFHIHQTTTFLFVVGVVFAIIGILLMYRLHDTKEIVVDYTYCKPPKVNRTCAETVVTIKDSCHCWVPIIIKSDIQAPVTFFYELTNFYQNHRNYVMSKDRRQLSGDLSEEVAQECKPYDTVTVNGKTKTIAPCGAIANSMFSDTMYLFRCERNETDDQRCERYVSVFNKGLVWPQIKQHYKNPPGPLKAAFKNFAKPVAWRHNVWELDTDPTNNGFENEDFIVWMQPATFSSFRKTYRRVDHSEQPFIHSLPKGKYQLQVHYNFPVTKFYGTKSFVIANTSPFGIRNTFMSNTFIFVGSFSLLLSIVFIIIRLRFSHLLA